MTEQRLAELIAEAVKTQSHASTMDMSFAIHFAKVLLFDCAKAVCFNCKDGNPSEPTKDPTHRLHRLGKSGYTEACRATAFFLEE